MSALEYAKYWKKTLVSRQQLAERMMDDSSLSTQGRAHWYGESLILKTQIDNLVYLIMLMEKECTQHLSS